MVLYYCLLYYLTGVVHPFSFSHSALQLGILILMHSVAKRSKNEVPRSVEQCNSTVLAYRTTVYCLNDSAIFAIVGAVVLCD
jgi:hypothetical protein